MRRFIACLAAGLSCLSPALADTYVFTVSPATSSASWNLSVNAPFQVSGDPRSFIVGNYDAAANPTGTRTLTGLIGTDNGLNNPINLSNGSVSASGGSGQTPLHPAGGMALNLNPAAGACDLSGVSLDLLNGSTITIAANASITYPSFRTRQPTCTVFGGIPLNIPVGNGSVTALTAVQTNESDPGTLTPSGPGQYTFSVPMNLTVSITATLNGAPFPIDPQILPVVLGGTVMVTGDTATLSATLSISSDQTQPGPITLDPIAFDEPLCSGHLLMNLVLASVQTTVNSSSSLAASGTRTCTSATIASSPSGRSVQEGDPTTFTVQASGSPQFSYVWRRGATVLANGGRFTGATSASLTINPVTQADAGTYTCTVTNPCGSAVSAGATLTVTVPPPACDPDYNQDGNADQDDVAYLVNVIAGGANPTGRDPDFNQDGNVDQEDYIALVNVVAGGPCP
jgi:hypothetical protein